MSRGRVRATLVVLAALALGGPSAAQAADATIGLAWDGTTPVTASTSFLGLPVTVPGDRAGRTLTVRNDGTTPAVLRAWVRDVRLQAPAQGSDDTFYDDLTLRWDGGGVRGAGAFRTLADDGATLVAVTRLAPGGRTDLELTYELPTDAESGNASRVGGRSASFVVHVHLEGDAAAGGAAGAGGRAGGAGALASTGADALRLALLGVVGIGTGSLLLGAARRRRRVQDADAPPAPSESTCDAR